MNDDICHQIFIMNYNGWDYSERHIWNILPALERKGKEMFGSSSYIYILKAVRLRKTKEDNLKEATQTHFDYELRVKIHL